MNLNKPNQWSEECAKSELDLFTVPLVQISVEDGVFDIIESSKTVNDNAVVTFEIPNSNDSYIDCTCTLKMIQFSCTKCKHNLSHE